MVRKLAAPRSPPLQATLYIFPFPVRLEPDLLLYGTRARRKPRKKYRSRAALLKRCADWEGRVNAPTAAADHPVRGPPGPTRINATRQFVRIPVKTPLPHVPQHIMEIPRIGRPGLDLMRFAAQSRIYQA